MPGAGPKRRVNGRSMKGPRRARADHARAQHAQLRIGTRAQSVEPTVVTEVAGGPDGNARSAADLGDGQLSHINAGGAPDQGVLGAI